MILTRVQKGMVAATVNASRNRITIRHKINCNLLEKVGRLRKYKEKQAKSKIDSVPEKLNLGKV